jgi:hypothetical protein
MFARCLVELVARLAAAALLRSETAINPTTTSFHFPGGKYTIVVL